MGITRIVLPDASEYERKCWRVDSEVAGLRGEEGAGGGEIEHVYGKVGGVRRVRRWVPRRLEVVSPLQEPLIRPSATFSPRGGEKGREAHYVPEAVEEPYFAGAPLGRGIGVFVRDSIIEVLDRTRGRVARTRDDIEWHLFDRVPTPDDLRKVEVWLDPAVDDADFDGFVAEALAMGRVVIASRTPLNVQRLEKGRTGFLVPPRDANELTHAILTALFKPEVARPRSEAARQTISKFRPRQRERALRQVYERLRS